MSCGPYFVISLLALHSASEAFAFGRASTIDSNAGPAGPAGAMGATGVTGATGSDGRDGTHGTNGQDGMRGAMGMTGPTGAAGAIGPTGPQGPQGPQGLQGPQGQQGPTGASAGVVECPTDMTRVAPVAGYAAFCIDSDAHDGSALHYVSVGQQCLASRPAKHLCSFSEVSNAVSEGLIAAQTLWTSDTGYISQADPKPAAIAFSASGPIQVPIKKSMPQFSYHCCSR